MDDIECDDCGPCECDNCGSCNCIPDSCELPSCCECPNPCECIPEDPCGRIPNPCDYIPSCGSCSTPSCCDCSDNNAPETQDAPDNSNNHTTTYIFCFDTPSCNPFCCWDYDRKKSKPEKKPTNVSEFKSNVASASELEAPKQEVMEREVNPKENKVNTLAIT